MTLNSTSHLPLTFTILITKYHIVSKNKEHMQLDFMYFNGWFKKEGGGVCMVRFFGTEVSHSFNPVSIVIINKHLSYQLLLFHIV